MAEEFERRLKGLQDVGTVLDPRAAQIERLKAANVELKKRIEDYFGSMAAIRAAGVDTTT